MVRHEVEDDLEPPGVGLGDQLVQIGEAAEERVDAAIIGDVVAVIGHGRRIDRRDPDGVDAEPSEVIEAARDAGEIADTVAVGVLERARIDLIDGPPLPPDGFRQIRKSRLA